MLAPGLSFFRPTGAWHLVEAKDFQRECGAKPVAVPLPSPIVQRRTVEQPLTDFCIKGNPNPPSIVSYFSLLIIVVDLVRVYVYPLVLLFVARTPCSVEL